MQTVPGNETFNSPLVMPKTVARLTLSRKYIFREFGVKLSLSQKDILLQIQQFAGRSENGVLRQLAQELSKDFPDSGSVPENLQ